MIFCIFIHFPFIANKSNFQFKTRSSIIILQFNNVSFKIKPFVTCQKFSWNSVQSIWGVIRNLIEINCTKIYENKTAFFFYNRKQNEKNSGRSMLNQSQEVLYICISFQESRDSIKHDPETKVYGMLLSYWRTF